MNEKLKPGTKVKIKLNGKAGQVVAVLEGMEDRIDYDVKSIDSNGTLSRDWFLRSQIEVVEDNAAS